MGNAAGDIHAGALGGLWQAIVFGFAGLDLTGDEPSYRPNLPAHWGGLSMQFKWRGQSREVAMPLDAAAGSKPWGRPHE